MFAKRLFHLMEKVPLEKDCSTEGTIVLYKVELSCVSEKIVPARRVFCGRYQSENAGGKNKPGYENVLPVCQISPETQRFTGYREGCGPYPRGRTASRAGSVDHPEPRRFEH